MAAAKAKQKQKRKKAARRKNSNAVEIAALLFLALGVFLAFAIFTESVGIVGQASKLFLFGLMGVLAYATPVLFLGLGVFVIFKGLDGFDWLAVLIWSTFVLCGIALYHVFYLDQLSLSSFIDFTNSSFDWGRESLLGGGVLGGAIVYPIHLYLGEIGTILVLACAMVAILLLNTGLSLRSLGRNVKEFSDTVVARQQERQERRSQQSQQRLFIGRLDGYELEENRQKPDLALLNTTEFETLPREEKEDARPILGFDLFDPLDELKTLQRSPEPEPEPVADDEELPFSIELAVPDDDLPPDLPAMPVAAKHAETPAAVAAVSAAHEAVADATPPVYRVPPMDLLTRSPKVFENTTEEVTKGAARLEETLRSFGVQCKVINVSRGPAITRYELQPAPGVKISRIVNLSNDIALSMAAMGVRIEAPIPGKAAIGVEIPNANISTVKLRDVLESPEFQRAEAPLTYCLGKDIAGKNVVADLAKMPHMLIAGATGSGKSVCINTIIISILYKSSPEHVKLMMIDPKVVELNGYNGIPHLLIPVVTDPKKAAGALNWAVQEMIHRYSLFAEKGARDLHRYNQLIEEEDEGERGEKLPQIVIIIDELADLMMAAPNEVEDSICRLAQMARAAGMHLVIATQRPSVDVITGLIKANIPSRIAFAVSSQVDSRTILDMGGAEKLLGRGDMLFNPSGANKPIRLQGAFITESEVEKVVEHIKNQQDEALYDDAVLSTVNSYELPVKGKGRGGSSSDDDGDDEYSERQYDTLLLDAANVIYDTNQASITMVQRRLRVGYARAARLVDELEELGIVGPSTGSKPREILRSRNEATTIIEQYR